MPYCVNCGVKLSATEKKCPLCETPLILSEKEVEETDCGGLPSQRDEPKTEFDKDLWIKLISVATAALALLTLTIDFLLGNGVDWSLYIIYSLALVWVWCVSPFLFKRNIFPLWFAVDTASLVAILFLVELTSGTGFWVLTLALPISLFLAAIIFLLVTAFQRKMVRQLQKPALIFFTIAFFSLFIEVVVDIYREEIYRPGWSVLSAIPLIAFAVILLILQRRQWIVEELRHWFRV